MPYTRPYPGGFVDFPSTSTPIDASALNTMDVGIKTANDQFQTVTTAQRATLTPSVGQAVWDSDLRQLMVYMNASGGNAWQPVGNRIVCASTTRPSSPFEGQEIYETDSQKTLVYSGSAWVETSDLDYSPSATVCTSGTRPATGLFEGQRIYETDTNREFTYSGSGWVQTNQWSTTSGVTGVNNLIVPPMVKCIRSTTTSYTSATALAWPDADEYDTDDMHSTSVNNSRITINTAGIYSITAAFFITFGGTLTFATPWFAKDGTRVYIGYVGPVSAGANYRFTLAHTEKCAAGSYLEVGVDLTGATTPSQSFNTFNSYFAATWIGRDS